MGWEQEGARGTAFKAVQPTTEPDPLTEAYGRGVGDALSGDTWDELNRLRAEAKRLRLELAEALALAQQAHTENPTRIVQALAEIAGHDRA